MWNPEDEISEFERDLIEESAEEMLVEDEIGLQEYEYEFDDYGNPYDDDLGFEEYDLDIIHEIDSDLDF